DGDQRPPHSQEIDILADEANGAVGQADVDSAAVQAAGGGVVVGPIVPIDAGQVVLGLVAAPTDIDEVGAGAVGGQLGVDRAIGRLVPPGHAALVVAGAARTQVLAQDHRVAGAVGDVHEAGPEVDAQGGPLGGSGRQGLAQVEPAEEGVIVAQRED